MRPASLRTATVCAAAIATVTLAAPRQVARAERPVQAPASALASVALTGRVVSGDGSEPVVRARIVVLAGGRLSDPVLSDDQGRFEIGTPAGGGYEVAVSKTGYLRQIVRRPSSRSAPESIDVRLTRSAAVRGRAVDPAGRPVVAIAVRVQRVDGAAASEETQTDDRGEFWIGGLVAGRYSVVTLGRPEPQSTINLTGDLPPDVQDRMRMLTGGSNPSSDAVAIEARAGAEIEATVVYREPTVILPYALVGGVITGQVIDEWGGPAEGLSVQLWQKAFSGGQPRLQPFGAPRPTDDRGQFRLFHIPAGRYFVVATDESWRTGGGPRFPWLPVYYPGRASYADATAVLVGRTQEVAGIDMVFPRNRGSRIFGNAFDSQGRPLQGRLSLALTDRVTSAALRPPTAAVSPDGAFEFVNVPPGNYVVRSSPSQATASLAVAADAPNEIRQQILALATRPPGAPEMESGMQPVFANGADVGPLVIRTTPTAKLSGRVVFQGTPPGEVFAIGAVAADPAFADVTGRQFLAQDTAVAARGGTFELPGLAGPIRLVLTSAPAGWWIKSARIGAIDAVRDPVFLTTANDSRDDVTVVVADTAATVGGSVVDAQGERADGCYVIVFSTNRDRWFIGSPSVRAVIATSSRFTVASLPPGEYWVAAVDAIEGDSTAGEWQYPELLDDLALSARRVTLGEGQRMTMPQRITVTAR